jgi:hypothetical protein
VPTKPPKIVAVATPADFDFRYGCTPAWWQLWKGEYDVVVSNSEGGLDRLRELGAHRARRLLELLGLRATAEAEVG